MSDPGMIVLLDDHAWNNCKNKSNWTIIVLVCGHLLPPGRGS